MNPSAGIRQRRFLKDSRKLGFSLRVSERAFMSLLPIFLSLDQKDGMEKQMNALSNMGLISCFIGMLTDSRSFLSFPRHEYFRRVLCNLFGKEMASGELPQDMDLVGSTIANICYGNAKDYFSF